MALTYYPDYNFTADSDAICTFTTPSFAQWNGRQAYKMNTDIAIAGAYRNWDGWISRFLIAAIVDGATKTEHNARDSSRDNILPSVGSHYGTRIQLTTEYPNSVFYYSFGYGYRSEAAPTTSEGLPVIDLSGVPFTDEDALLAILRSVGYAEGNAVPPPGQSGLKFHVNIESYDSELERYVHRGDGTLGFPVMTSTAFTNWTGVDIRSEENWFISKLKSSLEAPLLGCSGYLFSDVFSTDIAQLPTWFPNAGGIKVSSNALNQSIKYIFDDGYSLVFNPSNYSYTGYDPDSNILFVWTTIENVNNTGYASKRFGTTVGEIKFGCIGFGAITDQVIPDEADVRIMIACVADTQYGGLYESLGASGVAIDFKRFLNARPKMAPPPEPSIDPYSPGGIASTGGGEGTFVINHTPVNFSALPQVSATDSGFITIYTPTASQLKSLATFMWQNPSFDLSQWKRIFADPMEAILGLNLIPAAIGTSGSREVHIGNIPTGISLNVASQQFISVNCGSLLVEEIWGAYLDYAPYTQVEVALPYIGIRPLSADDIMGKTIEIQYNIDILSGACVCEIKCGDSVQYRFLGSCACQIPVTSRNWDNVVEGIMKVVSGFISGVTSVTTGATNIAGGLATGNPAAVASGAGEATGGMANSLVNAASGIYDIIKPHVDRSGGISGSGGFLGNQKPYLIFTVPKQCVPDNQNGYTGYPSFIYESLGSLSGYTEVDYIHLENFPCTAEELVEIESLLKGGVIL